MINNCICIALYCIASKHIALLVVHTNQKRITSERPSEKRTALRERKEKNNNTAFKSYSNAKKCYRQERQGSTSK